MNREQARSLLEQHIQADNLQKHCIATEAIMYDLAAKLNADPELWAVVGLLHDLDFEETRDRPSEHGLKTVEMLKPYDLPQEALDAIMRHNAEALGLERVTTLDYALTCAETITGMLVAATLVRPDKSIANLKPKSVRKRMKSKDFARNVNREHIGLCEQIGLPLSDFIELSIEATKKISDQLGL